MLRLPIVIRHCGCLGATLLLWLVAFGGLDMADATALPIPYVDFAYDPPPPAVFWTVIREPSEDEQERIRADFSARNGWPATCSPHRHSHVSLRNGFLSRASDCRGWLRMEEQAPSELDAATLVEQVKQFLVSNFEVTGIRRTEELRVSAVRPMGWGVHHALKVEFSPQQAAGFKVLDTKITAEISPTGRLRHLQGHWFPGLRPTEHEMISEQVAIEAAASADLRLVYPMLGRPLSPIGQPYEVDPSQFAATEKVVWPFELADGGLGLAPHWAVRMGGIWIYVDATGTITHVCHDDHSLPIGGGGVPNVCPRVLGSEGEPRL